MSEAFVRTAYDGALSVQVTAPSNAGGATAYSQISALMTGAQLLELAGKVVVGMALFTTVAGGLTYKHGTVGSTGTNGVLSTNSNPTTVLANQKPNEWIPLINAHQQIYVQAGSAAGIAVSVVLFYVAQESL